MWRTIVALGLSLALPVSASAGPLAEAAEKAGRELGMQQAEARAQGRGRFWTSIALIAGGGALAVIGGVELGGSENDMDDDDDPMGGDDSDAWEKAMLGGGIAAAALGGILLLTGRRPSSPTVTTRNGRATVGHTIRF